MKMTITEKQYKEYIDVQKGGLYNMFDARARMMTSLNKEQWMNIITNYKVYHNWNYLDEDDLLYVQQHAKVILTPRQWEDEDTGNLVAYEIKVK